MRSGKDLVSRSGHSFEELCLPVRQRVLNQITLLTRNETLAEDLVQQAYVRALQAWPRWAPLTPGGDLVGACISWLSKIATNQYHSERARARVRAAHEHKVLEGLHGPQIWLTRHAGPEDSEATADANTPSAVAIYEDSEAAARDIGVAKKVKDCLARLDPQWREIVERYYLGGQLCETIAVELKIPVSTVRTRLLRARKDLAPMLESYAREEYGIRQRRRRRRKTAKRVTA